MSTLLRSLALLSLAFGLARADTPARLPSFIADQVTTAEGKILEGKVYSSGTRLRFDSRIEGQETTSITDLEQKQLWGITPATGCIQLTVTANETDPWTFATSGGREELVGSEPIDGHPTKKYRLTTKVGEETQTAEVWRATDLGGVIIRAKDTAGRWGLELHNVVLGSPDPKLFTPPENCRSMAELLQQ